MAKIFVDIVAEHHKDRSIKPLSIKLDDGRRFDIDRVLDVRMAASLRGGGQGMRYTCRIANTQVYLFCDEGQWFIEK